MWTLTVLVALLLTVPIDGILLEEETDTFHTVFLRLNSNQAVQGLVELATLLGLVGVVPIPALRAVETREIRDFLTVKLLKSLHQFGVSAQQLKRMGQLSKAVGEVSLCFAKELMGEVHDVSPTEERLDNRCVVLLLTSLRFL